MLKAKLHLDWSNKASGRFQALLYSVFYKRRKFIFTIGLVALFPVRTEAQIQMDFEFNGKKVEHKFKEVTISRSSTSPEIESEATSPSTDSLQTVVKEYFKKGMLVKREEYSFDMKLIQQTEYKYDKKKRVEEIKVLDGSGSLERKTAVTHSKDPLKVKAEQFLKELLESTVIHQYSESGRLKSIRHYSGRNRMNASFLVELDIPDSIIIIKTSFNGTPELNGLIVQKMLNKKSVAIIENFTSDSTLMSTTEFSYDTQGKLTKLSTNTRNANNELSEYRRIEYAYSSKGMLISSKQFEEEELKILEEFDEGLIKTRTLFNSNSEPYLKFEYEYK